jgi:plastocyanin
MGRLQLMLAIGLLVSGTLLHSASAAIDSEEIRFENHRFVPQTVNVKAGKPLALKVTNASDETIEFESFKLNREIVITPRETITVRLPALNPGSYDFYDDFHQDVPEGAIVAK